MGFTSAGTNTADNTDGALSRTAERTGANTRTDGSEGFRVSPFAKRTVLPPMPGTPEGRSFGCISSTVPMPAEGSCYVVEFLPDSRARVLGYVDKFGRAFEASEALRMPPAYTPALMLSTYEDRDDDTGCVTVFSEDGSEHRIGEFRQSGRRYSLGRMLVRMGAETAGLSYDELFARLYLAACVFPREQGTPLVPLGLTEVYETLASEDLFNAVKRIAETERAVEESALQVPSGPVAYLARQLRAYRLDELDPRTLPRRVPGSELDPALSGGVDVRLARTRSYANAFYVGFDQDAVTPEGRSALLCLESVLNRFWLLTEELDERGQATSATEQDCWRTEQELFGKLARQAPPFSPATASAAKDASEWNVRAIFCRTCERYRLPFRLSYRLRLNLDARTMGVEAACPASAQLPKLDWDEGAGAWVERSEDELFANEAAIAETVAKLVLAAAFAASSSLETVSLDIVRDLPSRERVLSGLVSRGDFAAALSSGHELLGTFTAVCGLSRSVDEHGRMEPVENARELEGAELCPAERYVSPETDERPIRLHRDVLHGVLRIEDLAINEGADRAKLAAAVADAYEGRGRDAALAALKDMHDRSEDLTVRSVCTKAEIAVSEDALGEDPRRALEDLFADAWGLRTLRMRAAAQAEEDPEAARKTLEEIVLLSEADGTFADSDRGRWLYFDSYASRALFAWEDHDARPVRPLPDEIFAAHHGIANLLHGSFEEHEVALEHARKCTELAPSTAAGYLTFARAYFLAGDYPSEIDVLRRMLHWAWNPSDVGLALYWLAFALWRTGDAATGAACYLQAMKYDASVRDIATRELDELMRENPRQLLLDATESAAMVEAAGFPLSSVERNANRLVESARVAADNGNLSLAASLLSAGLRVVRDDALYPVLESLARTL